VVGLGVLAVALLAATLGHGVPPCCLYLTPLSHGPATAPSTLRCGSIGRQADTESGVKMAEDVRAEIVASVLEVVVHEGDQIGEGDTVVLLESMKMEIPVLAEVAGTVSKVSVSVGDVIQAGDLIAVIS
jgi:acetyl-CoA carboxylase biotin carboxyl carrier protein